jgi:hypothetical protein
MAGNSKFELTEKHHTSLGDIIDQASRVVVFGKILKDLQPTSHGHRFAQIFGYKRNNVCSKLPTPVVIALPDPDGPADDCGWDPDEFVKWQLPASFVSTQLQIQPVALAHALTSFPPPPVGLTAAQISAIISASIGAVGSSQPSGPGSKLSDCGILFPQQVAVLRANITSNVAQLNFTLDNNALAAISPSSTISDLAQAISGATQNA